MNKVIILQGLPASGKSTWAKEYTTENVNTIRLNRDDIRTMFNCKWSKQLEKIVIDTQITGLISAMCNNFDVIIDDTNLNKKTVCNIIKEVNKYNNNYLTPKYEIIHKTFFDVSIEECIERDSSRENSVGESVIKTLAKNLEQWF